jgi:hypothetical protein
MSKNQAPHSGRQMANDGYKPGLITEGHKPQVTPIPGKIQGGYTGPSDGPKPTAPSTGSGVAPPAPPRGSK